MSLLIYNPVCGSGSARNIVEEHVIPLIEQKGKMVDQLSATDYPGHAGVIVADYLTKHCEGTGPITIILASGDGTLHEIVNHLLSPSFRSRSVESSLPCIMFVLIPCGTANALYSSFFPPRTEDSMSGVQYKLQSLNGYLDEKPITPLSLTITTISSPGDRDRPRITISSVVTSTCLHASILEDSEALREQMPGIERFKVAAQQNSTRWYKASVKLLPCTSTGVVQIWDSASQQFVNHPESTQEEPIVEIHGPFAYFLSTVNVDRLEPQFRIVPLARSVPPAMATCDIVILRPMRDPTIMTDDIEARGRFVGKLWKVLGGAYHDGAHVNLKYTENGDVAENGEGPLVVEYVRCGGWHWQPDNQDDRAHLLCSDGVIFTIEAGAGATALAITPNDDAGFAVYT